MKNTKTWVIILTVIATLTFFNLKNYYDYYGKNYNNEREKIGVLKIPKTWRTKGWGTKTKLWSPENFKEITKGRIGKEVILKNGKIYLERDRIINNENNKEEVLEITYQFDQVQKFTYKYFEIIENKVSSEQELSQKEFQEILKIWQLNQQIE